MLARRWHACARTGGTLIGIARRDGRRRIRAPLAGRPAADPRQRHHLQRLQRSAKHRPPVAAGPDSAGARSRPNGQPSKPPSSSAPRCSTRFWPISTDRSNCCATACCRRSWCFRNPAFLRPCCDVPVPGGVYLHIYAADLARSPDGHWWVIADRTQAPSGRRLRARKSPGLRARAARCIPRGAHPPAGRLSSRPIARRCASLAPAATRESAHRAADARALQRDLFRARLPGPLPGLHAGGRRRSDGARQPRLPEDAGRPAAGGSDRAAPGRQLLRSRSNCAAIRCWACPGWCRRCAPATWPSPTRSARAWWNRPRRRVSCRDCAATSWAKNLKMPTVATWWCGEESRACVCRRSTSSNLVIKPTFPAPGVQPDLRRRG